MMPISVKKSIAIGTVILALGGGIYLGGDKDEVSAIKLLEKYNASVEIKAKYVLEGTKLVKTEIKNAELDKYQGEPKDEIKITLGNGGTEFTPDIELKRWNEVSFKLKPKGLDLVATEDKNLLFEGDKVKFKTPKMDFEMYDITEGEGGYKYIWYLNEKPATNKIEFDIESSGLDFFYQPELTPEEIAKGASRPENVVGSYAVYHQTKGGMNDINGKEYKAGKAFHIFRPHLIDANGLEAWGNLHIENGTYSVEIPLDFYNSAQFPIFSNDTFGYTTLGASDESLFIRTSSGFQRNLRMGVAVTPAGAGTVTQISMGLRNDTGTDTITCSAALNTENTVTDSHTQIGAIEVDQSITNAAAFYNFNGSIAITAVSIIINATGDWADITAGRNVWSRYDATGGSGNKYAELFSGAGSYATSKEDPWTTAEIANSDRKSIYATYTASGGGAVNIGTFNVYDE